MPQRADAHIHLFEQPLAATFPARPGVQIDEAACFDSLASENGVAAALIVCYRSSEGNEGNNEYVIGLQSKYEWVRPAAHIEPDDAPGIDAIEKWRDQGVLGLVMYPESDDAVRACPDEIWEWMIANLLGAQRQLEGGSMGRLAGGAEPP